MSGSLQTIKGNIILAGAGKMGGAMLSGWLAQGLQPGRAAVIEPHPSEDIRAHIANGVRLNPSPQDTGPAAAFVVALKPQAFREAAPGLKPYVDATTLVVSIMAGMTMASLDEVLGGHVVRAMPNTPAAIGRGITVAVAAKGVSAAQRWNGSPTKA
jgi:pyrroline-5-carboxylate reductase